MTKLLWIAAILFAIGAKAINTNVQFAAGFVLPWLLIGAVLSPIVWLILRRRFVWQWYHWLNTASIVMIAVLFLVNPLLQHFTSSNFATAQSPRSEVASPTAAPYKDVVLAWGVLLGATAQLVAIQEECPRRFPRLRHTFDASFSDWKARNQFMDRAKDAVYTRARLEGGSAEAARLSAEMAASHKANELKVRSYAQGLSEQQCAEFIEKLGAGTFDLRSRYKTHVQAILPTGP
jgi:signal transduction histidine kinase